jgi:hypothetical protein
MIEYHPDHDAVVAVKIRFVVESIRGDLKKGAITYVKARRPLIPLTQPAAGA